MTTPTIQELISAGALFVCNHSGGKDSQLMAIELMKIVPREQLRIVHANLGKYEWAGVIEHIEANSFGLPMTVVRNTKKTFMEMVKKRGMFPDKSRRQCTSDLKRDPIEKEIRRILREDWTGPKLVVNCQGLRAEESTDRAKLDTMKLNKRMSKAGREVWDWLPIHQATLQDVIVGVAQAGQKLHWAYEKGMTRLSCLFCIMASKADLTLSAQLNPEVYREYVLTERELDHTLQMSGKTLEEITGIYI